MIGRRLDSVLGEASECVRHRIFQLVMNTAGYELTQRRQLRN